MRALNLKEEKGITLVILIITIIILVIITTVTVNMSKQGLIEAKKRAFITELETIQQKMVIVNREISLESYTYNLIGTKYENLDLDKKNKIEFILNKYEISNCSDYSYLSSDDLINLGLKNISQNVIICYGKNTVYSYDGININNQIYYSIDEVNGL